MQKEERLGKAPVGKLMVSLAIPAVIAQLINVLYNIVDRIYIGHIPEIGDIALTGVGVTFPIVLLIAAFSYFVGMGGAPLASIKLGQQNRKNPLQWVYYSVIFFDSINSNISHVQTAFAISVWSQ